MNNFNNKKHDIYTWKFQFNDSEQQKWKFQSDEHLKNEHKEIKFFSNFDLFKLIKIKKIKKSLIS